MPHRAPVGTFEFTPKLDDRPSDALTGRVPHPRATALSAIGDGETGIEVGVLPSDGDMPLNEHAVDGRGSQ